MVVDHQHALAVALDEANAVRDGVELGTNHREADTFDRAIDLRITRLRRKIEHDPAHPQAIRTARGVGGMFVPS